MGPAERDGDEADRIDSIGDTQDQRSPEDLDPLSGYADGPTATETPTSDADAAPPG